MCTCVKQELIRIYAKEEYQQSQKQTLVAHFHKSVSVLQRRVR